MPQEDAIVCGTFTDARSSASSTMQAMPFRGDMAFRDCPHCGLHDAQMNVLATNLESSAAGGAYTLWSVLACPRCTGGILLENSVPGAGDAILRVIPSGAVVDEISDLPDDVAAYYRAAVTVLQAGVPDAAAVQLRKTLEAAAAHHGIDRGNLVSRIRHLIAQGLITKDFGGVLDHVRQVGNVGAHAGEERVDDATARRALRFTTQVLRNLFEIPAELRRLNPPPPDETVDFGETPKLPSRSGGDFSEGP